MIQVADNYQQAIELFEKGDYNTAEIILDELLANNKNDFDVLNFLGVINLNLSEFDKAIKYFSKVILLYKKHPHAHYNLAFCFQQIKENEKAIIHYKKVIELQPSNLDALNNVGLIYFSLQQYVKAEFYYKLALEISPSNPTVCNNLGNLCLALEKFEDATAYYHKAISAEPGNSDYHYNLGTALLKQKKYEGSLENLRKSIELNPDHREAYNNMGNIFIALQDYKSAEKCFQKVLSFSKEDENAYFNLGVCFQNSDKLDDANEAYKKALQINPDKNEAYINIGNVLNKKGEYEKSEEYFNKVLKDDPSKIVVLTNMGVAKLELGFIQEALDLFNAVLKINNEIVEAHYNKAHCHFLLGNLEEGWKEYEWRFKHKDFNKRTFSKPVLKNQDVKGKNILVFDEQGLGDSIQFVRYLKLLKQLNCKVIFECDPRLALLYKNMDGVDRLILRESNSSEPKIDYDYQIALLNLPLFFKTNLENIPSEVPYIKPDQALVEKFGKILSDNDSFKVGLVWGGNPKHTGDKKRSCPLKEFSPLFSLKGVRFYSLQMGLPLKQLKDSAYPVADLSEIINDMPDTAAFIENLDLVISVDTSVAHLAGAMAKNVWLLLPFLPDWRWMLNRSDTLWYPSMYLFRQKKLGDWNGVFEEVKRELEKQVQEQVKRESEQKGFKSSFSNPQSAADIIPNLNSGIRNTLYLGLAKGENFGWGVCSKYLKKELSKRLKTMNLDEIKNLDEVDGKIFHALTDFEFHSLFNIRGKENFGYTFFENELNQTSIKNSKNYDLILAGSTWCKEKMFEVGIKNTDVLIQGIDPELFYPQDIHHNKNLFIIFSGGKFELRKGQDIVLKAVKTLQDMYDDVILINAWYNFWPATMLSMNSSRFIKYEQKGINWEEFMLNLYKTNGLDPKRIFTLPVVPNEKLREIYYKTDIGLFPNRCEGGTNLVLMEYMACGKPVIASFNSGHKDILKDKNSYPLFKMNDFKIYNDEKQIISDWSEPDLDEVISKLEYAYFNRNEIKKVGTQAGDDMRNFTWSKTADDLIKKIFNR